MPVALGPLRSRVVTLIVQKELTDLLRDWRTIFGMIILPIVLYPLLLVGMTQLTTSQMSKIQGTRARVTVLGASAGASLMNWLKGDDRFEFVDSGRPTEDLRGRKIQAVVKIPDGFQVSLLEGASAKVEVLTDKADEYSSHAEKLLSESIGKYNDIVRSQRLEERGLPEDFFNPVTVVSRNVATKAEMGGSLAGRILPYLLIIMVLVGAVYPAIDLTAGEKERKTLETLLVSPARRGEIVAGKYVTVFLIALFTASLNLASLAMTFTLGMRVPALAQTVEFQFSTGTLVAILVVLLPLAAFFSGITMMTAAFARTYREAQTYVGPLLVVALVPAMVSMLPGITLTTTYAWVPILNAALLIKALMVGQAAIVPGLITYASSVTYAALALVLTAELFRREAILLPAADLPSFWPFGRRTRDPKVPGLDLLVLVMSVFFVIRFFGASKALNEQGEQVWQRVLVLQCVTLGAPLLLALAAGRLSAKDVLLLRPARAAALAASVAGGCLTAVAALALAAIQEKILPAPPELTAQVKRLFGSVPEHRRLLFAAGLALSAGVLEELVFRGLVQRGLRKVVRPGTAIVLTAALFAGAHLTVWQLPTALLMGLLLGWVTERTGSIGPAILMHVLHDFVLGLSEYHPWPERLGWTDAGGTPAAWGASAAAFGILLLLLRKFRPADDTIVGSQPPSSAGG